jgi:hypothetical protein
MSVLPVPNSDSQWGDFSGLHGKALKQSAPGVPDNMVFKTFVSEIDRGASATSLPVTPDLFEAGGLVLGGSARLNGPQGAFAGQSLGGASSGYATAIPPTVGSDEYAVELAELYWASLLRDVPFTEFVDGTANPLIKAAVHNLNDNVANYRGPVDQTGKVTPRLLFRGGLPKGKRETASPPYFGDEKDGPYLSQLCLWPCSLGTQLIDQKMQTYMPGQDFMTAMVDWYGVQQGKPPSKQVILDAQRRYMRDGRALAAFTHQDELYQAYLVAYLVLKAWQASPNPGSPYLRYKNQMPFGTFGGPDVAGTLGAIAKAAINAAWFQKWAIHLRHRPEAGGGLVHLWKTGAASPPQAIGSFTPSFATVLDPALKASAHRYSRAGASSDKDRTFLLSQAFPEGSPPHPAYPTGHGAVAGACITALKFFYDGDQKITSLVQPMVPSADGLSLDAYAGPDAEEMTVNGELHKLAHNISFGHGIHAGIHWRSDTDESMLFGESVALSFLAAQMKTYAEKASVSIRTMDGTLSPLSN